MISHDIHHAKVWTANKSYREHSCLNVGLRDLQFGILEGRLVDHLCDTWTNMTGIIIMAKTPDSEVLNAAYAELPDGRSDQLDYTCLYTCTHTKMLHIRWSNPIFFSLHFNKSYHVDLYTMHLFLNTDLPVLSHFPGLVGIFADGDSSSLVHVPALPGS